jgi:hypothetical protein
VKEKTMIERVELLKEIDAYKEMAADTKREQEANEWCNAYFGPIPVK